MKCLYPLTAYYSKKLNPSGRRSLVFDKRNSLNGRPVPVRCAQCMNCRLDHAGKWAVRLMHESKMHEVSVFLTLTYDEKHVPANMSLVKRDLQLFMKRMRKARPLALRFFACGEYGETTLRPHYHVILFGTSFPDMKYFKTVGMHRLYVSAELDGIWSNGFCTIGGVDYGSCAYVAGYVTKKVTGDKAAAHYGDRIPEFIQHSQGIARAFYEKYRSEIYRDDSVIVDGREVGVPRYYDKKYEIVDFDDLERIKRERRKRAKLLDKGESLKRRKAMEDFVRAKREFFKRGQI